MYIYKNKLIQFFINLDIFGNLERILNKLNLNCIIHIMLNTHNVIATTSEGTRDLFN